MARWSGKGLPNTRRKTHRFRTAQQLEQKTRRSSSRTDDIRRDASWRNLTKRAIVNPERFEEMWG